MWLQSSKRRALVFLMVAMTACATSSEIPNSQAGTMELKLFKSEMINGTSNKVTVVLNGSDFNNPVIKGKFEGHDFDFALVSREKDKMTFEGYFGAPFETTPGSKKVDVDCFENGKLRMGMGSTVTMKDGKYLSETLSVDPSRVKPPKSALPRIEKEQIELGKIYNSSAETKLWNKSLVLPIPSDVTSPFGTKRIYNGSLKGFHQGVDLKAAIGTPIKAPTSGKVVLAKDLWYTGNTVIIDHGLGFFTIYGHMSALKVKTGKMVEQGTLLGLAGKTGRANGPHLHWGTVLNHVKVDAMDLVKVLQ